MKQRSTNSYRHLLRLLAVFVLLLTEPSAFGQLTLSSSGMSGTYTDAVSITLSPGFSTLSGGTFQASISAAACYPLTLSLTSSQNYILTTVPRQSGFTSASQLTGLTSCQAMQTVQYVDGLGRPLQTVQIRGSVSGKDLVQPVAYDAYGREAVRYLPYAVQTTTGNDGSYKSNALTAGAGQAAFYASPPTGVKSNTAPYAVTAFEASPLNRVTEQGAPGAPWQLSTSGVAGSGHTQKIGYTTNNATVLTDTAATMLAALYTVTVNSDQSRTLVRPAASNYAAGQLYVTVSKDENWTSGRAGTVEEYKDKEDRVVLKRTFNNSGGLQLLSTYYVYDDLGNLAFVLPPGSGADSATPSQTTLDNLCYQYRYDERNRLSQKKLPGKGWEYMVYNQLDQVVLSQDAVQRAGNQWTVTKYDGLGRVVVTGLWNAGSVIANATLQSSIYAAGQWDTRDDANNTTSNPTGYTITSYPALSKVLTVNYYDDYTAPGVPSTFSAPASYSTMTKGLPTVTKVAVLNTLNNTTPDMLWSVNYYDDLGRVSTSYQQHYYNGAISVSNYDRTTNSYDFTNALLSSTRQHYNTSNTSAPVLTAANNYSYDNMGRRLGVYEQLNNGTKVLLSKSDYNEIGQLLNKHLHSTNSGSSFLQDITYGYNERGWMLSINDPTVASSASKLFSEKLNYNTPQYGATAQYNGNISEELYNASISGLQYTKFGYDKLNRLQSGANSAGFSETGISYDLMGNIQALTRNNYGSLGYTYTGNQLTGISGFNAGSYSYDSNGNLKTDNTTLTQGSTSLVKNLTFSYNLLNLPQNITGSKTLTYTYDVMGNKLRKLSGTSPTDYVKGVVYTSAGVIDFVQTEEGRAINNGSGSYIYEYTLTDHLGNNRITFDQTNGKVGEDDYYPFGLNIHRQQNAGNKYLYNKKELQEELNQYDYGARFYDPVVARWGSVDPLAEKMSLYSPYGYAFNNPIRFIDIGGQIPYPITVRGFHPDKYFGGGFSGDDRGYTTANSTARVTQRLMFDTDKNSLIAESWSSKSHALYGTFERRAMPEQEITSFTGYTNEDGSKSFGINAHVASANPFGPPNTPNVDIFSSLSITSKDNSLSITGKLTGDNYPSTEAFVTDPSGKSAFLGIGFKEGSAYFNLKGENKDRPITSFSLTLTTDDKGNFTGVNANGKTYTIDDWNKRFGKQDPHKNDNK